MSRMRKVAEGQEYGHYYPIEENDPAQDRQMKTNQQTQEAIDNNTQYLQDDRRVQYHVESDEHAKQTRDQLYDINPNDGVDTPKVNRIRVRMEPEKVLEDHKQRAYRVNVTSPVRSATDPGSESYALPNGNDPRQDEINNFSAAAQDTADRIKGEHEADVSTPAGRFTPAVVQDEDNQSSADEMILILFAERENVRHKEEGLTGTVVFANNRRVTVKWNDNTRERFTQKEANLYLAYVDDTEDQVDPLGEPSIETPGDDGALTKMNNDLDEIFNKAIAALDEEPNDGIEIEDGNPNKPTEQVAKVDIEKAKLQRKVNQYEAKEVADVKKKAASDLVSLMKAKGMIASEADAQEQLAAIASMDDASFEMYRNTILKSPIMKSAAAPVAPTTDPEISSEEQEARSLIAKHRGGGGGGGVSGVSRSDGESFGGGGGGYTMSDLNKSAGKNPFEGLTGLTAPIQVPSQQTTARGAIFDGLASMDWTVLTKQY